MVNYPLNQYWHVASNDNIISFYPPTLTSKKLFLCEGEKKSTATTFACLLDNCTIFFFLSDLQIFENCCIPFFPLHSRSRDILQKHSLCY